MILFVILGAMTLVAVLYGLIAAWRGRRGLVITHLIALLLVILAWSLGHPDTLGRAALAAAIGLEALAWLAIRHAAPVRSEVGATRSGTATPLFTAAPLEESESIEPPPPSDRREAQLEHSKSNPEPTQGLNDEHNLVEPSEADDRSPEHLPSGASDPVPTESDTATNQEVRPSPADEICVRTLALLSRRYNVTLSVVLASMKRSGLRDATLVEPSDEQAPAYIEVRGVKVGIAVNDESLDSARVEAAIAQSSSDEETANLIRGHAACIAVDVAYDRATSRADAVRMTLWAHAALTEFAPVVAVLWPEALRLTPVAELPVLLGQIESGGAPVADVCTSVRMFVLEGPHEGLVLFDSLGFNAFGLPDGQVVLALEDEARGEAALEALRKHLLTEGCDLPNDDVCTLGHASTWRVKYTRSAFDPDREVVQIRPDEESAQGG